MTFVTLPLLYTLFRAILWVTFECGQTSLKRHQGEGYTSMPPSNNRIFMPVAVWRTPRGDVELQRCIDPRAGCLTTWTTCAN